MDRGFGEDYDVLFENNSTTNYLVLRAKDSRNIINYQVQMLLHNKISGLLDFNINYIGGEINCFYNVTSRCSLASFMSRKKFSRNEFLIMLLNIINNVGHIKAYLLYDYNLLLDERYIYVDPEKQELSFVYLPYAGSRNDYKTFFMKLIIEMANFNEEESDNFLQKLLEVLRNELFSLSTFKSQLEYLLGNQMKNTSDFIDNFLDSKNHNSNGCDELISYQKESQINTKPETKAVKKQETASDKILSIKNVKIPVPKEKNNLVKATDNRKNLPALGFLILQPVLIIVYIITITSGFLDAGQNKTLTAIIALIIFVCVDILIFRLMGEKYKVPSKGKTTDAVSFITAKMRKGASSSGVKHEKAIIAERDKNKIQPAVPQISCHGETEIIKKPKIKAAFFKETEGNTVIEINKKSILLGRMEGLVDMVLNSSAIGKIHAEVLKEEDNYFIVDCNTKNGTFVNDMRLIPNTKHKVFNNDLIRFANKEFRFFNSFIAEEGKQ